MQVLGDILKYATDGKTSLTLMGFEGDGEGLYTSMDGEKVLNLRNHEAPESQMRPEGWYPFGAYTPLGPEYWYISLQISSSSGLASYHAEPEGTKARYHICAKSVVQ